MSADQHPVAASLAKYVSAPTLLLGMVMGLPMLDGVFAAVIISGGLHSLAEAVQVGLLLIGGSATLTVVLTEFGPNMRQNLKRVLLVGSVLIPVAAAQAALAPTIESVLDPEIFIRFGALVLCAIGARHASAKLETLLPTPGMLVILGLLASVQPAGATVSLVADPRVVGYAVIAASLGVGFALVSVLLRDVLVHRLRIERFRLGGGVALGVIGLSLVDFVPPYTALVVLGVALVLSLERVNDILQTLPIN